MHLFDRLQPDCRAARSRAIRLSLGILAALLVCELCENQAEASCGDYVHVGMPGSHRSVMADDSREPAPATPFERPCHGPGCRQNQPNPLIPTVPPPVSSGEHACLLIGHTIVPDGAWDNLADASPAPCAGYRRAIEPPPRTAAPSR